MTDGPETGEYHRTDTPSNATSWSCFRENTTPGICPTLAAHTRERERETEREKSKPTTTRVHCDELIYFSKVMIHAKF